MKTRSRVFSADPCLSTDWGKSQKLCQLRHKTHHSTQDQLTVFCCLVNSYQEISANLFSFKPTCHLRKAEYFSLCNLLNAIQMGCIQNAPLDIAQAAFSVLIAISPLPIPFQKLICHPVALVMHIVRQHRYIPVSQFVIKL